MERSAGPPTGVVVEVVTRLVFRVPRGGALGISMVSFHGREGGGSNVVAVERGSTIVRPGWM